MGLNAIALVSAMLLVSAITIAPTVTRVWGFGMMDENETAASKDNSPSPETTFIQNQLNCLNLDDGWWSPISGPIVVKACRPSANVGESSNLQTQSTETGTSTTSPEAGTQPNTESSTTSTPPTKKETSTPPTDVTETKDKEGNTVLSSTTQDLAITATVATRSIQEDLGIPEVAKEVAQQVANEEKDYNEGLLRGAVLSFGGSEEYAKYFLTPEEYYKRSVNILVETFSLKGKSDAYILGFSRGLDLASIKEVSDFLLEQPSKPRLGPTG